MTTDLTDSQHHTVFGPTNLYAFCHREGLQSPHRKERGVYVWSVHLDDGSFKIWYVGQTNSQGGFRERIKSETNPAYMGKHQLDLDEYARGKQVPIPGERPTHEYMDRFSRLTELFFIPMEPTDSPLFDSGQPNNLFKPAESAILRQLERDPELRSFTWNFSGGGRGIEMYEPRYPCILDCSESIRGLDQRIDG